MLSNDYSTVYTSTVVVVVYYPESQRDDLRRLKKDGPMLVIRDTRRGTSWLRTNRIVVFGL